MDLLSAGAVLVSLLAAWCGASAWRLASRSAPEQLVRQVGALRVEAHEAIERVQGQDAKIASSRAELEALMESIETVLDQVERKRRSTAASASRMARAQDSDPQSITDVHELERYARSRGLLS